MYYGWAVLLVAVAAMVGTLPGRTQGLGLITEPLLRDLSIDRVSYAQLNFWATIIGSAGALGIGRLLDRFGSRIVVTSLALGLGAVVCLMSQSATLIGLVVWMTLTRAFGQGALSVVSLAMVGHWFVRRLNTAMAVYSVLMSVGFMIAFPMVGAAIQRWGWRRAWLLVGIGLIAGLAPLALLVVRRSPEARGLAPDGIAGAPHDRGDLEGYRWREAIASPAFWVFAIGTAMYGLIASGIGLFNESILAERGFGPEVYYQTLIVTALTALAGNLAGGWLAGRVRLGALLAIALGILTIGLVVLPHVAALWHVVAWAAVMGSGGGLVMVLFFSVWPRVFGRRELGRIQGTAQAMTVLASALGPLLLAWCIDWTGSYAAMFRLLAGVIVVTAAGAMLVPIPPPAPPWRPAPTLRAAETTR
jgi:MFS family permease